MITIIKVDQIENNCLLQITFNPTNVANDQYDIHCIFNTAEISGLVLYGGDIDYCLQLLNSCSY